MVRLEQRQHHPDELPEVGLHMSARTVKTPLIPAKANGLIIFNRLLSGPLEKQLLHAPVKEAATGSLPLWRSRYQELQRLQHELAKDAPILLVRNLPAGYPLSRMSRLPMCAPSEISACLTPK